jgi:hypothetical protein
MLADMTGVDIDHDTCPSDDSVLADMRGEGTDTDHRTVPACLPLLWSSSSLPLSVALPLPSLPLPPTPTPPLSPSLSPSWPLSPALSLPTLSSPSPSSLWWSSLRSSSCCHRCHSNYTLTLLNQLTTPPSVPGLQSLTCLVLVPRWSHTHQDQAGPITRGVHQTMLNTRSSRSKWTRSTPLQLSMIIMTTAPLLFLMISQAHEAMQLPGSPSTSLDSGAAELELNGLRSTLTKQHRWSWTSHKPPRVPHLLASSPPTGTTRAPKLPPPSLGRALTCDSAGRRSAPSPPPPW